MSQRWFMAHMALMQVLCFISNTQPLKEIPNKHCSGIHSLLTSFSDPSVPSAGHGSVTCSLSWMPTGAWFARISICVTCYSCFCRRTFLWHVFSFMLMIMIFNGLTLRLAQGLLRNDSIHITSLCIKCPGAHHNLDHLGREWDCLIVVVNAVIAIKAMRETVWGLH